MIRGLKQEENDKDREQNEGIKTISNGTSAVAKSSKAVKLGFLLFNT